MNPIQIIHADEQPPQPWRNGGGQTRELLVWPAPAEQQGAAGSNASGSLGGHALCAGKGGACEAGGGHGAERMAAQTPSTTGEWLLRISRADIDASGPFSAFPGVQRWFVVLSGKGVVLHMPTVDSHTLDHHLLTGHAPLHFDGGLAPGCTLIDGPTQDLNLMIRGGTATVQTAEADAAWSCNHTMGGLYTAVAGTWSQGAASIALPAHSMLWQMQADATPMHFSTSQTLPMQAWWMGYSPEQNP